MGLLGSGNVDRDFGLVADTSLSYISLGLLFIAVMAWYNASKDILKRLVRLPKVGGVMTQDVLHALVVTGISLLWAANVAPARLPL